MSITDKAKKLLAVLPPGDYMRQVCEAVVVHPDWGHNSELFVIRTYRYYFGKDDEQ